AVVLLALPGPAAAQDARTVVTTQDADYFGFDLRTERDITLDACSAVCLADGECRAFTYNTRAQWCFLKSDYSTINPFAGAVAGKIVAQGGEPDIGAPPRLTYVPDHMHDDARRYRADVLQTEPSADVGIVFSSSAAGEALGAGDAAAAVERYRAALVIEPEDPGLWIELSRALFALEPS